MINIELPTQAHLRIKTESGWRSELMKALVRFHYQTYSRHKKVEAWGLGVKELLEFPRASLGYELGAFLESNGHDVIPKYENHDVFHVVLGYAPMVIDEIRMQFCLAGSGRRTLSTFATIIIGSLFYPRHFLEFVKAYRRGRAAKFSFSQNFKPLLNTPLDELIARVGISDRAMPTRQIRTLTQARV